MNSRSIKIAGFIFVIVVAVWALSGCSHDRGNGGTKPPSQNEETAR